MKKIIVLLLFIMSCLAYGQKYDTIFKTDGTKILCNIKEIGDFSFVYEKQGEFEIKTKKINLYFVERVGYYQENKPTNNTIGKNPNDNKEILTQLPIDTLKYLMNENAYLKNQVKDLSFNNDQMTIALNKGGKGIKTAGIFGVGAFVTGVLAGIFAYAYSNPHYSGSGSTYQKGNVTYQTFMYITGAMSVACNLAMPLSLISGGNKMKVR